MLQWRRKAFKLWSMHRGFSIVFRNGIVTLRPLGIMEIHRASKRGILHSRREEMPAVKAVNVNSCTAFVCPKGLHRKALQVSLPWRSSKVNAGHEEWASVPLAFSCTGCVRQAEHLALLLQHPSVLEYKLTLLAAWLRVLLQNFMVSELRWCACWFLLLKCDSNPDANFN